MNNQIAKITTFVVLLFFFAGSVQAQLLPKPKNPPKSIQSDPEATKILKQLQAKYEKFTGIYSDYVLIIDNRETKEEQNGKIIQKGDMFHVVNDGNQIFCDGVTLWMYMKKNNEVQINEYSKDDDPMSPNRILKIYDAQDEFIYAITNDYGDKVDIEFKPVDTDVDFSKLRLEIDKVKLQVNYIKVFAKDGTVYTLDINIIKDINPEDSAFKFNKLKFPGVKEVDMR